MHQETHGYTRSPWHLSWQGFDPGELHRTESTFALSNGHIGIRGTLEEGEPRGLPGTYLNGFHEAHELPYAEAGFGYPEDGQTVVNATDGKIIRLLVDDEPLDMRYGHAVAHERTLDFRSGTLARHTEWESPTGRRIRLNTERLVSFSQRAVVAIRYEVEPVGRDVKLVVQSDLLANEPIDTETDDPRVAKALTAPLVPDLAVADGFHAVLAHHTRTSNLHVAAAMDHQFEDADRLHTRISAEGDLARLTSAVDVHAGERLRLTKYLAYGWSATRSVPALRAQVDAAVASALRSGWHGLLAEQKRYLDDFWATADIEIDGDPELQQATRFALFQVLQAAARCESRAIPAKGLTGPGYGGHTFWDSETFVLQTLTYTKPEAARDALQWRGATLDKARERARQLGLRGAAFPWRSINGAECSAYWPAGTAAFHVSADIADASARYLAATGDYAFDETCGAELLIETARLWMSLGHHGRHGEFRIDGVTGPDEYTAIVDNNVYTNLMAQRNLREAIAASQRQKAVAARLCVTEEEVSAWHRAAEHMFVPYNEELGVHPQCEGFTEHAPWDFASTSPDEYPLLLNHPYFEIYRRQVIKQADLVLALHLRGDAFTPAEKARDFAYYEPLTVRDSSLSACTQAVIAAEVGQLDLAYDYFAETALTDLSDSHDNVRNGLHLAALAGAWLSVVAGFGGMRDHDGILTFAPRMPSGLLRISFRMCFQQSRFAVELLPGEATYRLLAGPPLFLTHHGTEFTLGSTLVTLPIPAAVPEHSPTQPFGRQPVHRPRQQSEGRPAKADSE